MVICEIITALCYFSFLCGNLPILDTDMPADISILIITYNRPEDTLALLENLNTQIDLSNYVGEILLLNNHSNVNYEMVTNYLQEHPELPVQYINHSENLGVARGRNFLIKRAQYPYLLVLDDDVVFDRDDALKTIAGLFAKPHFSENDTAVITLNIYYYETGQPQKNALPHKRYKAHKDRQWFLTYYFTGAAHLMKKELFRQTGYYPEDFFYGMEEYDLSYRIVDAGYTLAYDNSVKVLHKESPAGRITNKEKLGMMWYNKCVVARRYLPKKYFYSTALMWALEYLMKTGFDISGMIKQFRKIRKIPSKVQAQKINTDSLNYLKSVNARLWY